MLIPIIGVIDQFLSKIILVTRGFKIVQLVFISCHVSAFSSWSHHYNLLCFLHLPHITCKLSCLDCTLFSVSVTEHNLIISFFITMWQSFGCHIIQSHSVHWLISKHIFLLAQDQLFHLKSKFAVGSGSEMEEEVSLGHSWSDNFIPHRYVMSSHSGSFSHRNLWWFIIGSHAKHFWQLHHIAYQCKYGLWTPYISCWVWSWQWTMFWYCTWEKLVCILLRFENIWFRRNWWHLSLHDPHVKCGREIQVGWNLQRRERSVGKREVREQIW